MIVLICLNKNFVNVCGFEQLKPKKIIDQALITLTCIIELNCASIFLFFFSVRKSIDNLNNFIIYRLYLDTIFAYCAIKLQRIKYANLLTCTY